MAKFIYKNTGQVVETKDTKKISAIRKNPKYKEIKQPKPEKVEVEKE